MPTVTATPDASRAQVRLDLDFTDTDALYAYVTRVDAVTGQATAVRGHGSSTTIGGVPYVGMFAGYKAVLYDTEAPLDTAFYYVATAPAATLNANSDFALGVVDPWYPTDPNITLTNVTALSGTKYLTFHTNGAVVTPQIRGEDVPATPGATLTFTASVSTTVSATVTAGIQYLDSTGAVLSGASSSATIFGGPVSVVFAGTAPANTVAARPFITMTGTPSAATVVSISPATLTNAAASATSSAISVASLGACWLKDPIRPGNNVRVDLCFDPNPLCVPKEGVFFQSMDTEEYAANSATFNINNQPTPVVVSKVRSSVGSTLTLVTRTFQDRDRILALLAPGSPLLWQTPDEYGIPDRFMAVGNAPVGRVHPDHRFPVRVVSLAHVATASPGGPSQGAVGARWLDTCNRYASWNAVNGAGLTWIQVLDGLAG